MTKPIRILSLDGGGIRGIIPALLLAELESLTGKPISELFDFIAGTSTGGILALGLTKPNEVGKPSYSATEMVQLYEKEGSLIFPQSFWNKLRTFNGVLQERYPSAAIESVLKRYFGETRLKDVLVPVLVTSYETERRMAFFFKSRHAVARPDYDYFLSDVARATSAAPTYFEPCKIPVAGEAEYFSLIDGGMFANNPAMCAYVEAKTMFPDASDFLVVSLGTGQLTKPIYYDKAKHWGLASWAQPILNVVFDGVSDTVDYQLSTLLPTKDLLRRYYRFQVTLDPIQEEMDNPTKENLRSLKLMAEELIRGNKDELQVLAGKLVQ
ncbi:MAG: CBASS cGAMP-activated phospholipase [bacterium]